MTALEIVQHYYHQFNQKNWQGMLDCLSEDVRHDSNQGESHFGLEYFHSFVAHMEKCYDEELKDLVLFEGSEPGRVAVEFVVHGMYKSTDGDLPAAHGQRYVLPAGAFLAVEHGKITRVTTYYNLPEWIRQVS
ncbi:MAG: nuclear transport factor 2 family protein [Lewinellaceae bacterium]|nr:nuclear transport factor 2 family protein [Lewinellaceae bacterium]